MANFEALFLSVARNKKNISSTYLGIDVYSIVHILILKRVLLYFCPFLYTELLATFFLTKVSMYLLCCNTTILKQTYIKGFILITLYDINR